MRNQPNWNDMDRGIERLLIERPLYAGIVMRLKRVHDVKLDAPMAVGLDHSKKLVLLYNFEKMVEGRGEHAGEYWTDEQIDAVHIHECLHIVHRHLPRRMSGNYDDPMLWNIACDLAINQHIKGLPKSAIMPEDFNQEYGLTADEYYRNLLAEQQQNQKALEELMQQLEEDGFDLELDSHDAWQTPGAGQSEPQDGQGQGNGSGNGDDSTESDPWSAQYEAQRQARELQQEIEAQIRDIMRDAINMDPNPGATPGVTATMIAEASIPKVNWRKALAQFVNKSVKKGRRQTMMRPHRRYGYSSPGKVKTRQTRLAVLVDTSGSIDRSLLAQFKAELAKIATIVDEVTVAEVDTCINTIYNLKRRELDDDHSFMGGGGTDFDDFFYAVAGQTEGKHPKAHLLTGADAIVIFTDGFVHCPPNNVTGKPLLWAITPGGQKPVSYGYEVRL